MLRSEHNFPYEGSADFLSDFADNIWGRKETRFSAIDAPNSNEIADAERQIEEVRAKYVNTPQWLKAPNGNPTNLTERQWLMVRTPNFKKWFGDWEALAEYEFLDGKPIASVSVKNVPAGGFAVLREWATNIFKRQGGRAKNPLLGDVVLDAASVRDSLAHGGANLYKAAAFEVAKDVIEKGRLILNTTNKGRDSYYFAAPIDIDGKPNIVVALVHRFTDSNRFYLHSVGTKESLQVNRVSGRSEEKSSNSSTTSPEDYLTVLHNIFSVNKNNVSKVVDENGEPLVVYHGTEEDFTVFDRTKTRANMDIQGNFFSPWELDSRGYGSNVKAFFLNIKNPADSGVGYSALKRFQGENNAGIKAREYLAGRGYDGVNNDNEEYIAFNSEQIKSATDNVGTFSADNPDIRFSFIDVQKPDASNFDFTDKEKALYEAAVVPKYYSRGSKQAVKDLKVRLKIPRVVENEKLQLSGILSAGSLKELNSERAMSKTKFTSNAEVHSVAIANVEELFKGAILDVVSPDKKGKLKNMHRLYAPMFYNGKVFGVQITVKESKSETTIGDKSSNNKIYSIEAIDVESLFAKTPQEWESEYKRRNEKYLKKEDFEMSGELIVPKSERPDSPNSYELFSKSARSFLEDILNVNKKIAAKNVSAKFSAIDSDFEARKRRAAVLLAEKLYNQAGQNYNPENGNSEAFNPTEEQLQDVYMSEMDFLDEDVDEIVNQAMAIAYKMASRGGNIKNIREEARNIEDEFNTAKIVEACIKEAQRKWQKDLQASEKMKKLERRNLEAERRGITPWDADELAIENINLLDAITGDADAKEEIGKILEKCKAWADSEGVSYDLMLEKFKKTLGANFEDAASQFVRYRHIKSALSGIQKILESATEEQASSRAEKLSQKLADYFQRELSAFEEKEAKKAEKKAERENREKEKKAAQKLKEAHARAVKMLKKFARSQKLPPHSQLEIKRKLPARIQAYLAQIKKVMPLSAEEVKSRFQYLSEKKGKLEVDGEDLNYKERYEMSALQFFGNIDGKTLPELLEIRAKLKELIDGQMDEQAKRLEEMEEEIARAASPIAEALELSPNAENADESGFFNTARRGLEGGSMLEHRLRNVFLARKGLADNKREALEGMISEYSVQMGRASIEERRFKNSEMEWLKNTLRQVYKNKFKDGVGSPIEDKVVEYLSKPDKNFAKFTDIDAGGRVLSRGQLMQIVVSLEQWEVKEAWKQAQERMERLEKKGEDVPEKFEEQYAYWKRLFDFKPEMERLLSDEDKVLIAALKRKYRERLEIVNPVYERYNGLPMISSGLNYLPLVREGELNIESGGESNAIHLFPEYYAPRQISLKKLDEGANILQVFQSRTETDAHFLNFADLIFKTTELLKNKELGRTLKTRISKKELDALLSSLRDPLKGRISKTKSVNNEMANMVSTWTAYFGLAFNITSAAKQPTSFPAFMLQVPAKEWFKGFGDILLHPSEFFGDVLDVWNSPYLKDRRHDGEINQVLADIERESKKIGDENSIKKAGRRLFLKWAFAPIKIADSVAFVLGGTVVYRNFYRKYSEYHSSEEAKRLAAIDMLSIGEMTQQSAFIMNMSEGQRKDSGLGRMFSLFRTTNQQYLSFYRNSWKEFYARRDAESCKRFVKTFLLTRVILPALFNGMGILQNFLLGDDWDDDDWKILLGNTAICGFLDVYTGWWFSSVLKGAAQTLLFGGQNAITDTMLPANAVSRLSSVAFSAIRDVQKNGFADADYLEIFDKLLKTTFSPYRIGAKIYKNATDNKEGVVW